MHLRTRIAYDVGFPHDNGPPLTKPEQIEMRAQARAYHLCALGYMLASFHPEREIGTGWEDSVALRSFGMLIESISEGVFNDIEELLALSQPKSEENEDESTIS